MEEKTERAQREDPSKERIVWRNLAITWGVALLVRVVVGVAEIMWMWMFLMQRSPLPHLARYSLFVPSSVICALVASWMYPRKPLLAAAVPLLIPPDYGAPVGLLVALAMRRARTELARGFVTIGAVVLMMILWWLPLLGLL